MRAPSIDLFGDRIETCHDGAFDPATGAVTPTLKGRRLGAITLASAPGPAARQSGDRSRIARRRCANTASRCCRGPKAPPRSAPARRSPAPSTPASQRSTTNLWSRGSTNGCRPCSPASAASTQVDPAALRSALDGLLGYEALRASSTTSLPPSSSGPPAAATPSIMPRPAARPSKSAPRPSTAFRASDGRRRPRAADARHHLARRAGRSRPAATCPHSGREAGATSPRKCAAATPGIRGPTIPPTPPPTLRTKRAGG